MHDLLGEDSVSRAQPDSPVTTRWCAPSLRTSSSTRIALEACAASSAPPRATPAPRRPTPSRLSMRRCCFSRTEIYRNPLRKNEADIFDIDETSGLWHIKVGDEDADGTTELWVTCGRMTSWPNGTVAQLADVGFDMSEDCHVKAEQLPPGVSAETLAANRPLSAEKQILALERADDFTSDAMWQSLAPLKIHPCVMLKALLRWSDAAKAGNFLAACPWQTSIGDWRQAPWGYSPPLWPSKETTTPALQGELADYLMAVKKLTFDLRPPLDAAGMKRAGMIIGTAWEPADKNGRASDAIRHIFHGLPLSFVESFVEGSGFQYDDGSLNSDYNSD